MRSICKLGASAIYFSPSIKTFAASSDPLFFSSRRQKGTAVNNAELHSQTNLSCGVSRANEDGIQLAVRVTLCAWRRGVMERMSRI